MQLEVPPSASFSTDARRTLFQEFDPKNLHPPLTPELQQAYKGDEQCFTFVFQIVGTKKPKSLNVRNSVSNFIMMTSFTSTIPTHQLFNSGETVKIPLKSMLLQGKSVEYLETSTGLGFFIVWVVDNKSRSAFVHIFYFFTKTKCAASRNSQFLFLFFMDVKPFLPEGFVWIMREVNKEGLCFSYTHDMTSIPVCYSFHIHFNLQVA